MRVTARGVETKQWREPVFEVESPHKALLLAVMWQAGIDYHDAKRLQKRRNVKNKTSYARLSRWEKEIIRNGKRAYEWFTQPEENDGNGITFQKVCKLFGVRPSRMWWRIRQSPDLSQKLGELSRGYSKIGSNSRCMDFESVRLARKLFSEGVTQSEIAHRLGVGQNTISRVVRRETWNHVA